MGGLRSRSGCLTCRERHVKCDETKPNCGKCLKRHRLCRWEDAAPQLKIRRYEPKDKEPLAPSDQQSPQTPGGDDSAAETSPHPDGSIPQQLDFGWCPQDLTSPATAISNSTPSHESPDHGPWTGPSTAALPRQEAFYLHHYSEHLARWLDCTDASRQFTLNVPTLAKRSPILLYAVISFAARHVGDSVVAEESHEKCVELLIPLLSTETIANDEAVLCAIVILRVYEQLSVTVTGSDQERHLAGLSALLKTSQGRQVDPSAPTVSQAAFWVYVRQCLYNACVNQQPPNLDFDLIVIPPLPVTANQAVDVKSETAWANMITWICATVVHFCFSGAGLYTEPAGRMQKWHELSEAVEKWNDTKPRTFDPIWSGEPEPRSGLFPDTWFTGDWHGRYHP
ncbi:hypothetical protein FLONG3_2461 [Fusarium longipes]|uniref:Zn(2)-C6 fungal-type domain-containing protein n=1 Tax=Fusarium longipes TaxID=694270 RepID=A0A395T4K5_9HYPO|nr:hypothetical protein FLONG3_2461 [Fusarium longipes]